LAICISKSCVGIRNVRTSTPDSKEESYENTNREYKMFANEVEPILSTSLTAEPTAVPLSYQWKFRVYGVQFVFKY
jgi:hypothetical protein